MTTAIKIENVSKLYRLGEVGTGSFAHDINRWWHRMRGKEDPYTQVGQVYDQTKSATKDQGPRTKYYHAPDYFWALKDINLEVKQGEILGIIGRNGAGKSTLLKILSRVTRPTTGSIRARGRIASLLEVGTGFHPELTGRENVYLNGAILGMRKREITRKLDEIIDFSGCERYIDTPVKRYSSGMYVRLAFAVAAHLDPEIMIIDEVLAVGDAEFQNKCLGKMQDVADSDRTVIFVSHNLGVVRQLCREVALIEGGTKIFQGAVGEGLSRYEQSFVKSQGLEIRIVYGNLGDIVSFEHILFKQNGIEVKAIDPSCATELCVIGKTNKGFSLFEVKVSFCREGLVIANLFDSPQPTPVKQGQFKSRFVLPPFTLRPGHYSLGLGAVANMSLWNWAQDAAIVQVCENFGNSPKYRNEGAIAVPYESERLEQN